MIKLNNFKIGNSERLTIFGGVNVIESKELIFEVAEEFIKNSSKLKFNFVFKASFDKANRSSLDSYRGPGLEDGLKILSELKQKYNLPILTDIHEPHQAKPVSEVCDIIQIPAFLCRQTDLVVEAAKTGKIINLKKPQFMSAKEIFHVVKKCESVGNKNIILCERGNFFGYNNLVVDILNFQIMKESTKPVFFDVTHSLQQPGTLEKSTGGRGEYVLELAKAGISQGIAGLFLETHPDPSKALCDGPCALKLSELESFLMEIFELDSLIKKIDNAYQIN
jgi:2-dehydro-3-deoxyphosphooctonate aldolase (KDO 8-P synthase)